MIKLFKAGWGILTGHRDWLTLLAVAAAAAALYYQWASVQSERDKVVALASEICTAVDSSFSPDGEKTKDRGKACIVRVRYLARLERDTAKVTAEALAKASSARDTKTARDIASATAAARTAADAAQKMETENAKIDKSDRVGADWFSALSGLAGLRSEDH
jgi:hypothetical protein